MAIQRPRWTLSSGFTFFSANVINERHVGTSQMTEHPVESGSPVTDHVVQDLDVYACDIAVTDTPFLADGNGLFLPQAIDPPYYDRPITGISSAISAGVDAVTALVPSVVTTLQFPALLGLQKDFVREAYNTLYGLKDDAALCNITTPVRSYTNLVLLEVTLPRTPGTGGGALFSLSFKQFNPVAVTLTDVLASLVTASPRDGVAPDLGVTAKKPPDASEAETTLSAAADGIGLGAVL